MPSVTMVHTISKQDTIDIRNGIIKMKFAFPFPLNKFNAKRQLQIKN